MPDWNPKANDIFLKALELESPADQQAFIDKICGDDADLRDQVESLIKAGQKAGSFLEDPAVPAVPILSTINQPITETPGTQIGRYKLLQQIGEGGMGVVYMADQKEPVKRRVALKIIKPGMDTKQVIARFEAERQALAMMDHPNIAKVLDAGATESGRPYFVMELVNGLPLTKYCDEQHLTPKERLELFVPICQAVQHAHQKGIIHRDLKPSNILVAEYDHQAVPKVIDFGVAKATSQTLTEKTMFTQFGQVVGTLEYMSPEQAQRNQSDIDTRSDIYSLGVVLYELLTGEIPFDCKRLRSAAFEEMLRIIREEEPSRPSTKVSSSESLPSIAADRRIEPAKLGNMLRGELDCIVLKAMEKDRSRRYETANNLAEDLQRYLNDEPVVATPPSPGYRFKKFARRNKVALVTGAIVSIALTLATVVSTVMAVRESLARQDADQARQRAEESETIARDQATLALNTLQDVTTGVDNKLASEPSLADLRISVLESLSASWDKIDASVRDDEKSEADPTFMAIRIKLAGIFQKNGKSDLALKEIQKLYEMGLARIKVRDGSDASRSNLARICLKYGQVFEQVERDQEQAITKYQEAVRLMEDIVKNPKPVQEGPPQYITKYLLGEANQHVGNAYRMMGDQVQAHEYFREVHQTWSQLLANLNDDVGFQQLPAARQARLRTAFRSSLDRSVLALAIVTLARGETTEAMQRFDEALNSRKKMIPSQGDGNKQRIDYHKFAGRYGFACIQIDKLGKAEELLDEYLKYFRQLSDSDNSFSNRREYGLALYRYGLLVEAQNKNSSEFFKDCLMVRQQLFDEDPGSSREKSMLMVTEARCGNWQKATGYAAEYESNKDTDAKQNVVIARAYAQASRFCPDENKQDLINKAIAAVTRAVEQGFADSFELMHEPDLKPLRDVQAFVELVAGSSSEND